MISSSDLMCKGCNHRNICKNIDTYKKVVEAIHSVSVGIGGKSTIYITNIDWLKGIEPECKYYQL